MLALPDMALAAPSAGADGSVYVAARGNAGIRRLVPVPFAVQARLFAIRAYISAYPFCFALQARAHCLPPCGALYNVWHNSVTLWKSSIAFHAEQLSVNAGHHCSWQCVGYAVVSGVKGL